MMARIKDAEHSQAIAEMRQRIAELEIEVCMCNPPVEYLISTCTLSA